MEDRIVGLQGLFDKCIARGVSWKKLAAVFDGVGGYLNARGREPGYDDVRRSAAQVSTALHSMRTAAEPKTVRVRGGYHPTRPRFASLDLSTEEIQRRSVAQLSICMTATLDAFRFFSMRYRGEFADELERVLQLGLTEHLDAIDALGALTPPGD